MSSSSGHTPPAGIRNRRLAAGAHGQAARVCRCSQQFARAAGPAAPKMREKKGPPAALGMRRRGSSKARVRPARSVAGPRRPPGTAMSRRMQAGWKTPGRGQCTELGEPRIGRERAEATPGRGGPGAPDDRPVQHDCLGTPPDGAACPGPSGHALAPARSTAASTVRSARARSPGAAGSRRAAAHCALPPRGLRNGAGARRLSAAAHRACTQEGFPKQTAHAPDMRGRFQATLPDGDRSGPPRSPRADRSRCVPAAGRKGGGRSRRRGGGNEG